MVAADVQAFDMQQGAPAPDGRRGRAAAHVDAQGAQLHLILFERGERGDDRRGGHALKVQVGQLQAVAEGVERPFGHGDDQQVQPQRTAAHGARVVHAARPVHRPGDGQDVDRAPVRQADLGQGHADGARQVGVADRVGAERNARLHPVAGHLADGRGDDDAGDGRARRALGAFDGVADGLRRLVHVDDGPALDAARLDVAGPGDADGAVCVAHAVGLHDEAGDLGLAEIERGHDRRARRAPALFRLRVSAASNHGVVS
ncbi:hypothetical protein D3C77_464270 [compost metagenome]